VTENHKTSLLCCVCSKEANVLFNCSKCHSGKYCSKKCQVSQYPEHSIYCESIVKLESIERDKHFNEFTVSESNPVPLKYQRKLVKLVGERPLIKFNLNNESFEGLWDTGSMISLLSADFVNHNFPNVKMKSIEEFLQSKESIDLKAANNTPVNIEGVICLEFALSVDKIDTVTVPFLVTYHFMSNPIIGYNIIEHLVMHASNLSILSPYLKNAIPKLNSAEAMIELIQDMSQESDYLGNVKTKFFNKIPANSIYRVSCRIRVPIVNSTKRSVLFTPLVTGAEQFDNNLQIRESLVHVQQGKAQFTKIAIVNPTNHDIVLKKGTVIGSLLSISAAIPLDLRPNKAKTQITTNKIENSTIENQTNWLPNVDLSHLSSVQKSSVEKILLENCEAFSKDSNDIGNIKDFQMKIQLTDNVPVSQPYRKLPNKLYAEVKNYIDDLITNGWIKKSYSSYSSPIVCVRKHDGSLRICIDYRNLNKKTVQDKQPIPRIQDLLDSLSGKSWFSTLDMSKAYHQGFVEESSQKYTAFSTPWSLYEWLRIPMGLTNAPPSFQRYMNETLDGLRDIICAVYLDDILAYSVTFEEHLKNLSTILQRLRKHGIKLNASKCVLFKQEIKYLGRIINSEGYRADAATVEAIQKFKEPPKNVGELRSLLGFLGYYRSYVKDFSILMKPLYDLLKQEDPSSKIKSSQKNSKLKINWLNEHQIILEKMLLNLQSPSVMSFPDFEKPFVIHCDASNLGLGAVLYQNIDNKLKVVSYASRTLSQAEKNYHLHSGKLEFLALKWAVTEKFRDYLHYGPPFEVFTDNNPLTYVLTTAKLNATGLRWVAELSNFQFVIKYRPGSRNKDADYLSRNALQHYEQVNNSYREIITLDDINTVMINSIENESYSRIVDVKELEYKTNESLKLIPIAQLIKDQLSDENILPAYNAVKSKIRPNKTEWSKLSKPCRLLLQQYPKLKIENEVLYRVTSNDKQIILPSKHMNLVLNELHNKMAHLGSERVLDLARRRFYWPKMKTQIDYYIKNQCKCLMNKKPIREQRAPLVPIRSTYPFEIISIDFLHLDKAKGGYEYILVVCDHFTKFCQAYATKNKSAKSAADKIFNQFIFNYGFPTRIHHDKGGEFNNKLFQRLHELSGIKSSQTTPYHPMGDGQVERMNRTLLNMLKTLDYNQKHDWTKHLPKLIFAYNSTIHKTTNFTPFYLMFGRNSKLPIDTIFNIDNDHNKNRFSDFVKNWQKSLSDAIEIATKNADKSRKMNKNIYNKKVYGNDICPGDRVLLRNHREKGGTGKLKSYWEENIYIVIEKLKDLPVYVIRSETTDAKSKKIHRNNLMLCNSLPNPNLENTVIPKPRKKQKLVNPIVEPSDTSSDEGEDEVIVCQKFTQNDNISYPLNVNIEENVQPDSTLDSNNLNDQIENSLESINETESIDSDINEVNEFIPRRSTRTRHKPLSFQYTELGKYPAYLSPS